MLMVRLLIGHGKVGVLLSRLNVRRVQRYAMRGKNGAQMVHYLPPPSEQDHAHHAMKTVTKDATVQQGKTNDQMPTPLGAQQLRHQIPHTQPLHF